MGSEAARGLMISLPASPLANSQSPRENLLGAALPNIIPPSYTGYIQPSESYLPRAYGVNVFELAHGIRISVAHAYLVNKPLPAAGISADNVRG